MEGGDGRRTRLGGRRRGPTGGVGLTRGLRWRPGKPGKSVSSVSVGRFCGHSSVVRRGVLRVKEVSSFVQECYRTFWDGPVWYQQRVLRKGRTGTEYLRSKRSENRLGVYVVRTQEGSGITTDKRDGPYTK